MRSTWVGALPAAASASCTCRFRARRPPPRRAAAFRRSRPRGPRAVRPACPARRRVRARDLEHGVAREHLLELRHRAQRGQLAGMDEREAMAVLRLVQVVRGHEHRHARRGHLVDERPEEPAGERVDAARGLVEEDDARAVQDRAGEGQLLPPAARQLARQAVLLAAQARHLDGPALALQRLAPRAARTPRRRSGCSAAPSGPRTG